MSRHHAAEFRTALMMMPLLPSPALLLVLLQARGRVPGKTGVWVGERKIGAVGVRISHGISSHGVALNVTTDLSHYRWAGQQAVPSCIIVLCRNT